MTCVILNTCPLCFQYLDLCSSFVVGGDLPLVGLVLLHYQPSHLHHLQRQVQVHYQQHFKRKFQLDHQQHLSLSLSLSPLYLSISLSRHSLSLMLSRGIRPYLTVLHIFSPHFMLAGGEMEDFLRGYYHINKHKISIE